MGVLRKIRNVLREPHPARFVVGTFLMRLGVSRHIVIQRNGYRVRFWPSHVSALLWIEGPQKNTQDERVFQALLRPGDNVVDVGANVGTLTLTAARLVAPDGRVLGIEPHPTTFGFLRENVRMNPFRNIELVSSAVGREKGHVGFSNSKFDDVNHVVDETAGIRVPVERLDDLAAALPAIRLLKIDVEGFEPEVLGGGSATLSRTDAVFVEWHPTNLERFGYTTDDLFAPLRAAGFHLYRANRDGVWSAVDANTPRPKTYANVLGVRDPEWWARDRGVSLPHPNGH